MRTSIGETWELYENEIMHPEASEIQRFDTKKAFYAGAAAMFQALNLGLEASQEPTQEDLDNVDPLLDDLSDFLEKVKLVSPNGPKHYPPVPSGRTTH